jgi:hypothetical protein
MKQITTAIGAFAMASALAASALADNPRRRAYLFMGAEPTEMDMTDPAKEAMLMKVAKKLPVGTIVYVRGGELWIAQDTKMADGKMLSDMLIH